MNKTERNTMLLYALIRIQEVSTNPKHTPEDRIAAIHQIASVAIETNRAEDPHWHRQKEEKK